MESHDAQRLSRRAQLEGTKVIGLHGHNLHFCCLSQEVAEMLVKNESRIKFSQAMTTYRYPRQVLLTFKLRLQVSLVCHAEQRQICASSSASDNHLPLSVLICCSPPSSCACR